MKINFIILGIAWISLMLASWAIETAPNNWRKPVIVLGYSSLVVMIGEFIRIVYLVMQ